MPRLALDLDTAGNALALQLGRYAFEATMRDQVLDGLGHRVVFGHYGSAHREHVGIARLEAVRRMEDAEKYEVLLTDIVFLGNAPLGDIPHTAAGYRWLSDAEWLQIEGTMPPPGSSGLAEAGVSLESYRRIYTQLLKAYEERCAFTGAKLHPQDAQEETESIVVAIRPRAAGGDLHVGNYLVLSTEAARAFALGLIAVGPDYGLLIDHGRIVPELLERLRPSGKMRLPADRRYWPDPANLAYHRQHIFARAP